MVSGLMIHTADSGVARYGSTPIPSYAQKAQLVRSDGSIREIFGSGRSSDITMLVAREMAAQMRLLDILRRSGITFIEAYSKAPDVMNEFVRRVELTNATSEAFKREKYLPDDAMYTPYVERIMQKIQRASSADCAPAQRSAGLSKPEGTDDITQYLPSWVLQPLMHLKHDSVDAAAVLFYVLATYKITPQHAIQILNRYGSQLRLDGALDDDTVSVGRLGSDGFVRPCRKN